MEITGILKTKTDTQKVSDKFQKREFVLTTEASTPYPQHVSFQLAQDKCSLLDSHIIGEEIKVQFNLKGREWNGPEGTKYFNTLDAWKIEKISAAPVTATATAAKTAQAPAASNTSVSSDTFSGSHEEEDMPF